MSGMLKTLKMSRVTKVSKCLKCRKITKSYEKCPQSVEKPWGNMWKNAGTVENVKSVKEL